MFFAIILTLLFPIQAHRDGKYHSRPIIIGHRGVAYVPELTIAAQSMAYGHGADIIEIDVCLSRDNQLIVIHGKNSFETIFSFQNYLLCFSSFKIFI